MPQSVRNRNKCQSDNHLAIFCTPSSDMRTSTSFSLSAASPWTPTLPDNSSEGMSFAIDVKDDATADRDWSSRPARVSCANGGGVVKSGFGETGKPCVTCAQYRPLCSQPPVQYMYNWEDMDNK